MNTKKLINTLRLVPITTSLPLTDEGMVKAITINENIRTAYGYTFKPEDIVKIAKSETDVWNLIKEAIPDVKADPMYPDFPTQVMDIDEAEYRFHQMIHYFSTYGIETLFGVETKKGWLPDVEKTEKVKEDKFLFDYKILEVIEEENLNKEILKRIVEKKQRMTLDERELVANAIKGVDIAFIKTLSISFKENLQDIFLCVVDNVSRNEAKEVLTSLCVHSGDVLKCVKYYLGKHRYKISTSQKKLFVKILESYTDFAENIMQSNMKREEVLVVLNYLDYNNFSRSPMHKKLVAELRNKDLKSWYSKLDKAFSFDKEEAIKILAQRPGEFLRRINECLNRGMNVDDIVSNIESTALSLPTLVRLNTFFDSTEANERFEENKFNLVTIVRKLLFDYLASVSTPLAHKKVYVDECMFDFDNSTLEINDKSDMSEYIRSGMAYKIPDEAKFIRFFTYWNDTDKRIDIDLHAKARMKNGELVHVGWDEDYEKEGIVMSGDITHSDAAEFIDVDLSNNNLQNVFLQIDDYTRKGFNNIDEVLCGIMAVSEMGIEKDYKLYTPKNCFFSNDIKEKTTSLYYGYVDVEKRYLKFIGTPGKLPTFIYEGKGTPEYNFTLTSYLNTLFVAQKVEKVNRKEEADLVIRLDKGLNGELSLIDENFFLNC